MTDLSANYDTTVDAMSNLASSVGGAADNARLYQEQVQAVTKNLSSLNAVYEMELQDAQQHLKSLNQFYGSMANAMENMVDASRDAEQYRTEVASLTKNISALNKVYGGMLSAMNTGNA
jgi:gliding motility-associated protein GldL